MSSPAATAKRLAKTLNVQIVRRRDPSGVELEVAAPEGHVWTCASSVHTLVVAAPWADAAGWALLYTTLADDMAQGIERCPDADCDTCHPL